MLTSGDAEAISLSSPRTGEGIKLAIDPRPKLLLNLFRGLLSLYDAGAPMPFFRKSRTTESGSAGMLNILPRDNMYTMQAMSANDVYRQNGWDVRLAAVRMVRPGELEVALVVPTEGPGTLQAALDKLPGHDPVFQVVAAKLEFCHHPVRAKYFADRDWATEATRSAWEYHD